MHNTFKYFFWVNNEPRYGTVDFQLNYVLLYGA